MKLPWIKERIINVSLTMNILDETDTNLGWNLN